jgi:hypothetical protein
MTSDSDVIANSEKLRREKSRFIAPRAPGRVDGWKGNKVELQGYDTERFPSSRRRGKAANSPLGLLMARGDEGVRV